jgi:hypothetical protein
LDGHELVLHREVCLLVCPGPLLQLYREVHYNLIGHLRIQIKNRDRAVVGPLYDELVRYGELTLPSPDFCQEDSLGWPAVMGYIWISEFMKEVNVVNYVGDLVERKFGMSYPDQLDDVLQHSDSVYGHWCVDENFARV